MAAAWDAWVCGRGSACGQHAAFPLPGDQCRLETEQASFAASWAAERQEDKAGDGGGMAQQGSHSSASQRRWRTFQSLMVCREAGLEQSWLTFAEEQSEV